MEAFIDTVLAIFLLIIAAAVTAVVVTICISYIVRTYYDIQYEKINGNKKNLM